MQVILLGELRDLLGIAWEDEEIQRGWKTLFFYEVKDMLYSFNFSFNRITNDIENNWEILFEDEAFPLIFVS